MGFVIHFIKGGFQVVNIDNRLNSVVIVIPSLNPDEKIVTLVENIRKDISQTIPIIVVDDGSDKESKSYFNTIQKTYQCRILTHSTNKGKGAALKTAFKYILTDYPSHLGVITVDGDGQHTTDDVRNCILTFIREPETVLLGSRNFERQSIPLRSRFGNILTRKLIKNLNGLQLTDTQTGLRVLPLFTLDGLLNVQGDRYEYEMNMLLHFKDQQIPMNEIPIQTLYIENNESSHFNPLKDSIKIYSVFIKYSLSALASFGVDILLFALLIFSLKPLLPVSYIIISTILARLASASFNYLSNKYLVFKTKQKSNSIYKYSVLFALEMLTSALVVHLVVSFTSFDTEWLVKILTDIIIFCVGFYVQKNWVFKKQTESSAKSMNETKI